MGGGGGKSQLPLTLSQIFLVRPYHSGNYPPATEHDLTLLGTEPSPSGATNVKILLRNPREICLLVSPIEWIWGLIPSRGWVEPCKELLSLGAAAFFKAEIWVTTKRIAFLRRFRGFLHDVMMSSFALLILKQTFGLLINYCVVIFHCCSQMFQHNNFNWNFMSSLLLLFAPINKLLFLRNWLLWKLCLRLLTNCNFYVISYYRNG